MQALHYRNLSRNCTEGVTDLFMITVKICYSFYYYQNYNSTQRVDKETTHSRNMLLGI